MEFITKSLAGLAETSGVAFFMADPLALVMVGVACLLLYLAIVKQFEPLLLLPIAFGMLLTNLLGSKSKAVEVIETKTAETYVDTGVKVLIAVVIGALLLTLLYALFEDTIMPSVVTKVQGLFNYAG